MGGVDKLLRCFAEVVGQNGCLYKWFTLLKWLKMIMCPI